MEHNDTREDGRNTHEHEDPTMIVRHFAAEAEVAGDGRTIDVRIVPYGERATVADGFGGVARGVPYQEEWMPGVFDHQLNAAHHIVGNFEHQPGIGGIVAKGVALRSAADGFYGSFRPLNTPNGETTLELVKEGVLTGVSLEARPTKGGSRRANGVVQRVKAHLFAVAFCRRPAFAGAQVLAVRAEEEIPLDVDLLPAPMDPELLARCRALGVRLPQRYRDTPAETDTPRDVMADQHDHGGQQ